MRFCTSTAIVIVNILLTIRIVLFIAPKNIFIENGAEFNNAIMKELGEPFNVKVLTTAAESPWSKDVY